MRIAGWTPKIAGLTEDTSAEGILEKISPDNIPASAKKIGSRTYWTTKDSFDFPDPEAERRRLNGPQAELCLEMRMSGASHYAVREVTSENEREMKEVYIQGKEAREYSVTFYRVE